MVEIELKKIDERNVILFKDPYSKAIKDFAILSSNDKTKNLDNYFLNIIKQRVKSLFEDKPFSLSELRKDLSITYGIKITNSKSIDYTTSRLLKDVYISLKYQELEFYLDFLKGKITKEGQKLLVDKILSLKVDDENFKRLKEISKKTNIYLTTLITEIKYLVMQEAIISSNLLIKKII